MEKHFPLPLFPVLAKDNKVPLIIVIAGTSTNLFNQTTERLKKDLQIDSRSDRSWVIFENPRTTEDAENIESILENWNDDSIPLEEKSSVMIVVMKHHSHINNLVGILRVLDLQKVSSLIIDDEADQAGLNTQVQADDVSTTYGCLLRLRQSVPSHTYLQYTATPQAPLLIDIIDRLSPDFAEILTPGEEYIGGRQFFDFKEGRLIESIPTEEVPTKDNPIQGPPESLLKAMRIFYLSVAIGLLNKDKGHRSMMVHPSRRTAVHGEYSHWIRRIKENWLNIIKSPNCPDYSELIMEFKKDYNDLSETVSEIPSFKKLIKYLKRSILQTFICEMNAASGPTPIIKWNASYSHILVGGQAMDRGYTVEGLTVTYMPRGPGVGNADTIQQRARFYGYKKNYLEYCRIFLEPDSRDAFENYIEHEDFLRDSLSKYIKQGKSLKNWKRIFFLDSSLNPTRRNILATEYKKGSYSNQWFNQKTPHGNPAFLTDNRNWVDKLHNDFNFVHDEGHADRTPMMCHYIANNISINKILDYLIQYKMSNEDLIRYTGVLLQIKEFLTNNQNKTCTVYIMSLGKSRNRSINNSGEISQLFQGEFPVSLNKRGTIYPGDREIKLQNQLTVQIHKLNIKDDEVFSYKNVPTIAIWVPKKYERDWIYQPQRIK